jgi:endonuclease-8
VMAGLGNLYRTELCFVLGVTPWTPVNDVATLERAPGLAHRLLTLNRDGPAQVTTGRSRRGEEHWVYRRRTCLRCATPVRRAMQGRAPHERVTYWCPSCQRGPVG